MVNAKVRTFVNGRRDIFKNIRSQIKNDGAPIIWVHCASLGEFEQSRPIIGALKEEYSRHKILLTFFSPSGYTIRKNYEQADYVFYLPWDTPSNARKFVSITKPILAIFIKYEFWYNFTHFLRKENIPLISVSSIFRSDQLFFRPYGAFSRRILKNFNHFFVQNSESTALLKSIDLHNATRVGDTRFDRVYQIVKSHDGIDLAQAFKNEENVLVAGSCWAEDLEILIPFINENHLKVIMAPHEIDELVLRKIEEALHVPSVRFSKCTPEEAREASVLIIDNIGMLARLYGYGEYAYVGGGFGKGLHNILEAACYGIPILFGNRNYKKFNEATELINRGGAFPVDHFMSLKTTFEQLNTPETFLLACEVTRSYVEENLGATEKIMAYCRQLLK